MSQASLSRYESGKQAVDPATAARLDHLLNAGGALRAIAEGGAGHRGSWEDIRRRALLRASGGVVAGGAVDALDSVRRRVDVALAGGTVGERDFVEWERVAEEYSRLICQLPAERVVPELLVDLDDAQRHLGDAPEHLRPGVVRVCALLGGLTAIALVGAGRWSDAGRYWRLALRAARLSGDRATSCLLGGRRAVFSLYAPTSNPDVVLALADDALAWGDGRAMAGTASALAARAQVFRNVG